MSRDKQIEEMAKIIGDNTEQDTMWPEIYDCANALYNAGYRKVEDIFEDIFEGRLEVVNKRSGDKLKKASDLAEEIFAEIEKKINLALDINCKEKDELIYKGFFTCEMLNAIDNKNEVLRAMAKFIAELKKKYTIGEEK